MRHQNQGNRTTQTRFLRMGTAIVFVYAGALCASDNTLDTLQTLFTTAEQRQALDQLRAEQTKTTPAVALTKQKSYHRFNGVIEKQGEVVSGWVNQVQTLYPINKSRQGTYRLQLPDSVVVTKPGGHYTVTTSTAQSD